jgi:hypothetical protein
MRDYWLNKLFFDLQSPPLASEFRANQQTVLSKYALDERVKRAIAEQDVPFLAARTNPYLLRYYFFATGMKDDEFIRRLQEGAPRQLPRGNADG